jgi:hypothetical protein
VVVLIATAFRPFDPGFYGSQSPSHVLAAYLLPVALMTLTWYWTLRESTGTLIWAIAPVIVTAMCADAVIEIAQLAVCNADVVGFLRHFWAADPSPGSVAAIAAENGRYTGIFGPPLRLASRTA